MIVDSEPLHWAAMNQVLALHGLPQVTKEYYYEDMLGLDDRGLFAAAFARAHRPPNPAISPVMIAQKSERFLAMASREKIVLPGVPEFVESVSGQYCLAICSGALRREIETILQAADLLRYFSIIVGADDVQRGKPDPQGYLLAMRRLQDKHRLDPPLLPAQCLVIEDSMPGIEAGKDAGMTCLAVTTSVQGELLLQADAIVATLREANPARLHDLFDADAPQ